MKELLFSVTKKDFDVQRFRAGGKGGQKQNKTSSAVRIIHRASGARGESRTHRSQHRNKDEAFRRLLKTPEWRVWHARRTMECLRGKTAEQIVEEQMRPEHIRVETLQDGEWVQCNKT